MTRRSLERSNSSSLSSVAAFGDSFSCSQFGALDLSLDENDFEEIAQEAEVAAQTRLRRRRGMLADSLVIHKGRLKEAFNLDELLESDDERSCDERESQRSALARNSDESRKWPSRSFDRKGRRVTRREHSDSLGSGCSTHELSHASSKTIKTVCYSGPEKQGASSPPRRAMARATASLDPQQLVCFTLKRRSEDTNLGLRLTQLDDGAIAVMGVTPGGLAAATPLRAGVEILSIRDHRIRDAERCVEMFEHYRSRDVEVVASDGARAPGTSYVMVKRGGGAQARGGEATRDDSFHGLVLEEDAGRVRVVGFGESGMFLNSTIGKGDVLLSFDGCPVHRVKDCRKALEKATRLLIPVLIYKATS